MKEKTNVLILERVAYGKATTKTEDREYKVKDVENCPIGNIEEWVKYCKANGSISKMRIIDIKNNIDFEVFI